MQRTVEALVHPDGRIEVQGRITGTILPRIEFRYAQCAEGAADDNPGG